MSVKVLSMLVALSFVKEYCRCQYLNPAAGAYALVPSLYPSPALIYQYQYPYATASPAVPAVAPEPPTLRYSSLPAYSSPPSITYEYYTPAGSEFSGSKRNVYSPSEYISTSTYAVSPAGRPGRGIRSYPRH